MVYLPTLTTFGFVKDPNFTIKKLYEYYVTSYNSQSRTFYNSIRNLQIDMQKSDNDPQLLKENITNSLNKLYSSYFKSVKVDVIVNKVILSENKHMQDVKINVTVVEGDEVHTLTNDFALDDIGISNVGNGIEYILNTEEVRRENHVGKDKQPVKIRRD